MTTNEKTDTQTHTRTDFVFDGFGVNGPDEYRSRLATLTDAGHAAKVGPLLAAAPDLLRALTDLLAEAEPYHIDWARLNSQSPDHDPNYRPDFPPAILAARAVLKRLKAAK